MPVILYQQDANDGHLVMAEAEAEALKLEELIPEAEA